MPVMRSPATSGSLAIAMRVAFCARTRVVHTRRNAGRFKRLIGFELQRRSNETGTSKGRFRIIEGR